MRFLLVPFLVCTTMALALMLWWRPAPEIISIQRVDWGAEYEALHTPREHIWGAMDLAQKVKRSGTPHQPLTEFIRQHVDERGVRVQGKKWQEWYKGLISDQALGPENPAFCSVQDWPLPQAAERFGYVQVQGNSGIQHLAYHRLHAEGLSKAGVPAPLRFPFRQQGLILLAVAGSIILGSRLVRSQDTRLGSTSAEKGCILFMALVIAGVALCALPFVYFVDNIAPPALFMGGFLLLMGLIGFGIFGYQVRVVQALRQGRDCLAHWTFSVQEWQRFLQEEYQRQDSERRGLLIWVSVIILIIGGGFGLVMGDAAALIVFCGLLGLILVLWVVAVVFPWLVRSRKLKGPAHILIGTEGTLVDRTVHTWNLLGSRLETVHLDLDPQPLLTLVYSYVVLAGSSLATFRHKAYVRIPVPQGREDEARKVVERLTKRAFRAKG